MENEVVRKNQSWAVQAEATQGIYAPPAAASAFVQTLAEGAEMSRSKEVLERNIYTSSIGKISPRTGQFSVSGALPVEARASSVEGGAPEFNTLMLSALGSRRQLLADVVTGEGHTTTRIQIEDADTKFAFGDIILVKEAGAFFVSPVKAVTATYIDLLVAAEAPFSDNVVIAKHTTYGAADVGHPSFSVSRFLEGAILQQAVGCKVTSLSLEGFSTGQLASFNFAFEGLNFDQSLQAPAFVPNYDGQVPPIILAAKVFQEGMAIDVNDFSFSLENTLGYKTSVTAENGRVSSRPTERVITGSTNPYMESDNIKNYERFKKNELFSLFCYCKLPAEVAGEFGGIVAVFLPNCLTTDLGEGDQDGIMQDSISFSANRGNLGSVPEIFIGFI